MKMYQLYKLVRKYQESENLIGEYSDCDGYGFGFLTLDGTVKVDVSTIFGEIVAIHLDWWNNKTNTIEFSLDWSETNIKNNVCIYGPNFETANKLAKYAMTLR